MADKKSVGRQKIPIAKIEKEDARYATFSKRRKGLYKKASELIGQYDDLDIGIIMFSPTGKPYSFVHPTVDAVTDRLLYPNMLSSESNRLAAENSRNKVKELQVKLDDYDITENDEADEINRWDSIEEFDAEEIKKDKIWFKSIDEMLKNRLIQLENGASPSAQAAPKDAN
ncbi:agamous-like MADS-box protein AGL61 [Lycium ferocissimum]|uniref:agamous-like MADS-box protein AGL61 n=1 Tax=Lycium ferocissimum TaxID=112874 RepID=UPI002814D7C3|nr:agamous-like MADS-box protein AGL61 [Lycium ferocissimum]